jgi:hypothetical protein
LINSFARNVEREVARDQQKNSIFDDVAIIKLPLLYPKGKSKVTHYSQLLLLI